MPGWITSNFFYWILCSTLILSGLYLMLRGLIGCPAKGRQRCYQCFYDMTAATSLTCPECGHTAPTSAQLLKTRRNWRNMTLGLLIFTVGLHGCVGSDVRTRMDQLDEPWYMAIVPTTALILLIPKSSDKALNLLDKRIRLNVTPIDTFGSIHPAYGCFSTLPAISIYEGHTLTSWQARILVWQCKPIIRETASQLRYELSIEWIASVTHQTDTAIDAFEEMILGHIKTHEFYIHDLRIKPYGALSALQSHYPTNVRIQKAMTAIERARQSPELWWFKLHVQ